MFDVLSVPTQFPGQDCRTAVYAPVAGIPPKPDASPVEKHVQECQSHLIPNRVDNLREDRSAIRGERFTQARFGFRHLD